MSDNIDPNRHGASKDALKKIVMDQLDKLSTVNPFESTALSHYCTTVLQRMVVAETLSDPTETLAALGVDDAKAGVFSPPAKRGRWRETGSSDDEEAAEECSPPKPIADPKPWKCDGFLELYCDLKDLEKKSQSFERKLDKDIFDWLLKKHRFFERYNDLEADKTPNYSRQEGHFVRFPKLPPQNARQFLVMTEEEKIQAMSARIQYLDLLYEQFEKDLQRLWYKSHDGKSCRYYQKDPLTRCDPETHLIAPTPGWPWYLKNGDVVLFPRSWEKVHQEECIICTARRQVHRLQCEFERLQVFLKRMPNSPHLIRGFFGAGLGEEERRRRRELWSSSEEDEEFAEFA